MMDSSIIVTHFIAASFEHTVIDVVEKGGYLLQIAGGSTLHL